MMLRTIILWPVAAVLVWAALTGAADDPAKSAGPSAAGPATRPVELVYLFSPTCAKCKEASKLVDAVAASQGDRIRVRRLDVHDPDALEQAIALEEQYQAKPAAPPRIFVGSTCLTGLDAITEHLADAVSRALAPPASQPDTRSTSQPGK